MATINEIAAEHVSALEELAAQPAPDSARATYEYAFAAAMEMEWLERCFSVSSEDRDLLIEEVDFDFPEVPGVDAETKIWKLPGLRRIPSYGNFGSGEHTTAIAQSLETVISRIESTVEELEPSDEMVHPLCALGLNLTVTSVYMAAQNPNLASADGLSMRAVHFCLRGMKYAKPKQNLSLLCNLDDGFIETAKIFAACVVFDSIEFYDHDIENPGNFNAGAVRKIDEQLGMELNPIDLMRAESFLRGAMGVWSSGLRFIDPVFQPVCRERMESLLQGANTLRALALGRPPTGRDGLGPGQGR